MASPVVLITGALTGIGRATAFAYAKEKGRVVVSGRNEEVGAELVRELRATGAEAEFVRADVRHEEDVKKLVDKTIARFGRLDIAVNNAGTEGVVGSAEGLMALHFARSDYQRRRSDASVIAGGS